MKKTIKIILGIILIVLVLGMMFFTVDYKKVQKREKPIFCFTMQTINDGGTIEYYGLGYKVIDYHTLAGYNDVKIGTYLMQYEDFKEEMQQYEKDLERRIARAEKITTLLTLEDQVKEDAIWCGAFQLIWNDLKNDLAKQDVVFSPQLKVVENLNKETFQTKDISGKYYYKKVGTPTLALKQEIEKAIKEKFNETSDILDDFDWQNRDPKEYFLYAMLKKEFQFEKEFEQLEDGKFRSYENVKYFGIKKDETGELGNQVKVLYYHSKDDFAMKLKTKQEDEVILCKNPTGKTFDEIYQNITKQENEYQGSHYLEKGEQLKIPNIKLKEKNEFTEIENKQFLFSNGDIYLIEKALQTIQFELDRTGGKIKSEAGMEVTKESIMMEPKEKREFFLDDTFAMFLIEQDKNTPYFAAKIQDITIFQ